MPLLTNRRVQTGLLWSAVAFALCVGILGRGYWTPDEPREADISWRMSWQADKTVPLLAGEPFCEKPPLAYWIAGAAIDALGTDAWAARLPNLLYALISALAVASIGRRGAGPVAGWVAAAAISTFLLSYQVAIWLATDAPLLAAVSVALLGLYAGFYADAGRERLRGYSCMHAALALGFLSKSAAAWMVPALTLSALIVWEKRWRELWRWELYAGVFIQAAIILTWVALVYQGPDGAAHLRVFFWNNLVGRFAQVNAPLELQYAGAHRNSPGKYLIELPVYLWPWTLLVVAAARRAYVARHAANEARRLVRFAVAAFVPGLAVLSVAATARNIYLAPALPGLALLLGWWVAEARQTIRDVWDARAVRCTSALLLTATLVVALALLLVGVDAWQRLPAPFVFVIVSSAGLLTCMACALSAWRAAPRRTLPYAVSGLLLAYCALLIGPASQLYRVVNDWQNLATVGRALAGDSGGRPLILYAADETTRAFVDMYAKPSVQFIPGPIDAASTAVLRTRLQEAGLGMVLTQMPGRAQTRSLHALAARFGLGHRVSEPATGLTQVPEWARTLELRIAYSYELPNGRRYALLEPAHRVL